jgi:hypothetical protein
MLSFLTPNSGYLGFFEFVHNAKKRGKGLLNSLLELIMS